MEFDYVATRNFEETLIVQSMGNCCIKAKNIKNELFYLRVKSIMGMVYILKILHVDPQLDYLLDKFEVSFKSFKYSEKAIKKEISLFLNSFDNGIVEACEVEEEEMFNDLPNIKEHYKNC